MTNKKKKPEEHENVERWMVSYADFVTLLFCFFTAMYAISNIDTSKLGKFVKSMRSAFNASETNVNTFNVIEGIQIIAPPDAEVEAVVKNSLESVISGSKGGIEIRSDRRGIVISVMDKFLFETGAAKLRETARPIVDSVASALKRLPNVVRIEGHTDNVPINNNEFSSNWELSAKRAINVSKYFVNAHGIQPERISAIGYAEYKSVASNNTPEGRAKNRRVDIVILNDVEAAKEPG
ncbi:MAG: OmpA family protein [Nitrospirae bacterium]|nr:OmpA family protein [Nitrospirota bacterium]